MVGGAAAAAEDGMMKTILICRVDPVEGGDLAALQSAARRTAAVYALLCRARRELAAPSPLVGLLEAAYGDQQQALRDVALEAGCSLPGMAVTGIATEGVPQADSATCEGRSVSALHLGRVIMVRIDDGGQATH